MGVRVVTVTFIIEGRPGPKGSRTVGQRKNGSTFTRPASKFEKAWEGAVSTTTAEVAACHGQLEPPYRVTLEFARERPARPTWAWPSRDDIDKLIRCTVDGMVKGGLLVDDRHVTAVNATEAWAHERQGCRVTVESVEPGGYASWR